MDKVMLKPVLFASFPYDWGLENRAVKLQLQCRKRSVMG